MSLFTTDARHFSDKEIVYFRQEISYQCVLEN